MATKRPKRPGGWPTLQEIAVAQQALLPTLPALQQEGVDVTRTCWACGYGVHTTFGSGFKPTRAHIVAKVNGGTLDPSNFLLLCDPCHKDHPDGASPEEQFEWARHREQWRERNRRELAPVIAEVQRVANELGGGEELFVRWVQAHAPAWWTQTGRAIGGAVLAERYFREADTVTAGPHNLYPNMAAAMTRSLRRFAAMSAISLEALGFELANVAWVDECARIAAEMAGVRHEEQRKSWAAQFG